MKQPDILIIYLEPTPYILGLLRCLEERNPGRFDVLFAANELSQRWNLADDTYKGIPRYSFLNEQGLYNTWRFLWQRLLPARYSIVHLAGWSGHPVLLMALLLAAWKGIQITVESDTPIPYSSTLWRKCCKRLLYPLLFRLPAIFFPGGTRQAAYLEHYGVPSDKKVLANMTVDVTGIMRYCAGQGAAARERVRDAYGLGRGVCVFMFAGRLEPHKGLQDLVDAFALVQARQHGSALLVVGEGSMDARLQSLATHQPGLLLTGRLSGTAVLDAYLAADVLVLPSHFEPWGLVVNEAMAAGLPVIVTDRVGCIDDLVEDRVNGLIVPAGKPALLAAAMHELVRNPALRATMTTRNKQKISTWTLENAAEIMTKRWNSLETGQ